MRAAGLPVPAMHDRHSPLSRAHSQAGFVTALVLPLWGVLAGPLFAGIVDVGPVMRGMAANLARYRQMVLAGTGGGGAAAQPQ